MFDQKWDCLFNMTGCDTFAPSLDHAKMMGLDTKSLNETYDHEHILLDAFLFAGASWL